MPQPLKMPSVPSSMAPKKLRRRPVRIARASFSPSLGVGWVESSRPTISTSVGLEDSTHPTQLPESYSLFLHSPSPRKPVKLGVERRAKKRDNGHGPTEPGSEPSSPGNLSDPWAAMPIRF